MQYPVRSTSYVTILPPADCSACLLCVQCTLAMIRLPCSGIIERRKAIVLSHLWGTGALHLLSSPHCTCPTFSARGNAQSALKGTKNLGWRSRVASIEEPFLLFRQSYFFQSPSIADPQTSQRWIYCVVPIRCKSGRPCVRAGHHEANT